MCKSALFVFLFLSFACQQQSATKDGTTAIAVKNTQHERLSPYHQSLYKAFEVFEEGSLKHRRFKHEDILPLLAKHESGFQIELAGRSLEGRSIHHLQWGQGPVKVLLWSQMHGDEPTATMALFDIFNFLVRTGDEFDQLRAVLRQNLSLHFLPMLNPDGAERYQRRNAVGVDLNRDAQRLQCPESIVLKRLRDDLQADWGFNLHDQNRYYGAGNFGETASVSFLAPAYNYEKEINAQRADAMQMIVLLNDLLQQYIPGKVARYDDAFEPRAFGDNMQLWGTRTILVESGGLVNDLEKQELRRLHFVLLLSAFHALAEQAYSDLSLEAYEAIPMNNKDHYLDLLIREAQFKFEGQSLIMDLGFRRIEANDPKAQNGFYNRSQLFDIGDLSVCYGYDEFYAKGYTVAEGKLYPTLYPGLAALRKTNLIGLLQQGYTGFRLQKLPPRRERAYLPIELVGADKTYINEVRLYGNPALVLKKDGVVEKIVVNGQLYDLERDRARILKMIR
jgi:hypothetical protein